MKKLISVATFVAVLSISSPAFAGWQQDIQSAVNSGNSAKIDQVAANYPGSQADIAMYLLTQAQGKLGSNPELAAKLFAAANPFVNQINAPTNKKAAGVLLAMVNSAKDGGFQQKNCVGALTILGAALSMSSLPNISSVAPNLHATTLSAANDAIESSPKCDTKNLEDQVNLAELPGTPPTVGPTGAVVPSAD